MAYTGALKSEVLSDFNRLPLSPRLKIERSPEPLDGWGIFVFLLSIMCGSRRDVSVGLGVRCEPTSCGSDWWGRRAAGPRVALCLPNIVTPSKSLHFVELQSLPL